MTHPHQHNGYETGGGELRRVRSSGSRSRNRGTLFLLFLLAAFSFGKSSLAQQSDSTMPDLTQAPKVFPHVLRPYQSQKLPEPDFKNSAAVPGMIQDGKLQLSVEKLLQAVVENNLDIVFARYGNLYSETDILRAKAGQAPRGGQGVSIPSGLFAGALGQGLGGSTGFGGGGGGAAISGTARAVNLSPRGTFDPTLALDFSLDSTSSPLNSLRVAGVPTVTTHTASLSARYTEAFTSGTSFSFTFNSDRETSTQRGLRFDPSLTPSLSLTATQQLLNGRSFAVNRRFLTVAQTGRKISQEFFRQQVVTTLAQALNSYSDLVAFRETVRTAEQALQVAQQLYEDNKKQAEVGTLAPLDVVSAESEVAARRHNLIVAQTNLQQAEVQLKTLFSRELDPALAAAQIEPTDPLPEPKDSDIPKLDDALAAAQKNRPELSQAEGNIQNQEVAVTFTENLLKPTLTLFGRLTSNSLYGERTFADPAGGPPLVLPGGWSQAFSQVTHLRFPEYAVGFSLTIPLKNRSAQADNVRARLEERQAETALQRTRNQIALEVRNAVTGLMQSKAQVEAAQKAVEFEKQTVDAEQKKLAAGTSTPYKVILVQRDLFSAELAEVQARANYAKSLVEMDRSTGLTLEKHQISLDDVLRRTLLAGAASPAH